MQQEPMDKAVDKIGFVLNKITTEQYAVIDDVYNERDDVQLQVKFRFAADDKLKMVGVFANFTFEVKQQPFIRLEVGCHFAIKPESWDQILNTEDNMLTIPVNMIQHLAVITVGTARGVLHTKTENTQYNRFFLPTINIAEMVDKDQSFNFTKAE